MKIVNLHMHPRYLSVFLVYCTPQTPLGMDQVLIYLLNYGLTAASLPRISSFLFPSLPLPALPLPSLLFVSLFFLFDSFLNQEPSRWTTRVSVNWCCSPYLEHSTLDRSAPER